MPAALAADRVLRGDADPLAAPGPGAASAVALGPLARATVALAAASGACVGSYGLFRPGGPEWRLLAAATLKVPLLIVLTLLVTFPSLYVFSALLGSRLRAGQLARVVAAGCLVLAAVAAGFGPVVAFFSLSTTSYPFVVLLNVGVFALGGLFAAAAIRRPVAQSGGAAGRVLAVWLVLFGLVGSQMGWVLRPFVGAPGAEFAWLRPRGGSFFEGVIGAAAALVSP